MRDLWIDRWIGVWVSVCMDEMNLNYIKRSPNAFVDLRTRIRG
jgi:hypothetical protein